MYLNTQIKSQSDLIQKLNKQIAGTNTIAEQDNLQFDVINALNDQVKNLNETISLMESKILYDQGLVSILKKQQEERSKSMNGANLTNSASKTEQDLDKQKADINKDKRT
jgi:uncharacterized coiled-coil protein SlyX